MRFCAVILFLALHPMECGNFEDAKDLLGSFKSVVELPLSKHFKKAHRFTAFTVSFLKRAVPFAELFATALKVGLEEDQLDALLNLTSGIDGKINDIARQWKYIQASTLYRDLLLEYNANVNVRIGSLLRQIGVMSRMRNVSQALIDVFVHECNGINSPATVAQYLSTLVRRCAEPHLPVEATTQLFKLINTFHYRDYTLAPEEQHLFAKRFALVLFWLCSHPEKISVLEKFEEDRRNLYLSIQSKLVLMELLMQELGIKDSDKAETLCLPKAAFLANGYNRDSIERLGDLLMEDITSLEYVTVMCANISFYGRPDQADIFTLAVGRILEPVYAFVSNWLDALLASTWPSTESLLIGNILQDLAKGTPFAKANATYTRILDVVHERMQMVGHPNYRRQYVATAAGKRDGTELATDFTFACRPNACTISTAMKAHVISVRTQIDTNEAYELLLDLIEFTNASAPIFQSAMDRELYRYTFVNRAIQVLAEKYKLDLNNFANHSSYVLVREDVYSAGCSNAFAVKSDNDLGNSFLQILHYHEDGTKFTDCEDWIVILGF